MAKKRTAKSQSSNDPHDDDFEDPPPTKRVTRSSRNTVQAGSSKPTPARSTNRSKATSKKNAKTPKKAKPELKETSALSDDGHVEAPELPDDRPQRESALDHEHSNVQVTAAESRFWSSDEHSNENTIPTDSVDHEAEESDDDMDWETVDVPSLPESEVGEAVDDHKKVYDDVEVVFEAPRAVLKRSKWEMAYERMVREWIHNSHVVALIAHYMLRNSWCASQDVQSVCLSVIPDYIQNQSASKEESFHEFQTALKWALSWWKSFFTLTGPGLLTWTYNEIDTLLTAADNDISIENLQGLANTRNVGSETIKDTRDFVEKLTKPSGTSDTSAELFIAILRALDFDVRLVASLQPIPYRVPAQRSENERNKANNLMLKAAADDQKEALPEPTEDLAFPFRSPRPRLDTPNAEETDTKLKLATARPPTVWAEVYDTHNEKWICIDPVRGLFDQPKAMEPSSTDRRNIISYVLAFDADKDGCTDVTRRYSSRYSKAVKLRDRELTKREKEGGLQQWSDMLLNKIQRRKHGPREQREKQHLEAAETQEAMPTSIQGFNNHPVYALERHLKKFEVLHPKEPVLGHIKGEKIYPRSCVKPVHTAETWMKYGRVIGDGEQPIKRVNARAVTAEKKRMQELAKQEGETLQVGCYGEWQTVAYKPSPVVDGRVPRNAYGNIDLFTPDMLPEGAAHIPIDGIGKVARKLGVDFADAVVGFDFVKRRSVPVTRGIVVAKEAEQMLLEAWGEFEQNESNKAIAKHEKETYARWRKIIMGVLIHARVEEDYGQPTAPTAEPANKEDKAEAVETKWESFLKSRQEQQETEVAGGGFVSEPFEGGYLPEDEEEQDN
ncbi:uncharacterized protein BYT42DRAFT_562788 [Radiomyces spectabilis]|uniref:uncharacterized protein n=1 Tax=Radiomyces spectabilis TaxID=64574 RepID=UPI00221E44BE|nr:uncharacterized protein BYT42DRAFT_562788 [Radiomyces spectabilis]KAI8384523.1 hypothetical protein BYT42DRAFT_562788 [Radiomyces spectabilis]